MPDTAPVLHALGGLYYQLQRNDLAGKYLEQAWREDPTNPDYLNDLGAFLLTNGKFREAVSYLEQLVARSPDSAEAYYNLGLALQGAERLSEAIAAFEQVVHLRPDYAAAYYYMGATLQGLGQYPRAEEMLRKAIRYAPELAMAHLRLGEILEKMWRQDAALVELQKAHELARDNIQIVIALADALHICGHTREGIGLLQAALGKHPAEMSLMISLGKLLHIAGQIDAAEQVFTQALTQRQDASAACLGFARIRKFTPADTSIIKQMESLLENEELSELARQNICFALGKIHDDCAEYDKAFHYYATANAIQKKVTNYDKSAYERGINDTITVFTREFFNKFAALGTDRERPVFIVGMPRSGTTLTEQILVSHPLVADGGELEYFSTLYRNLPNLLETGEPYPFCCHVLQEEHAGSIIRHYLELLDRHSVTARFVTDKMPGNFLFLGLIRMLFPKAPVIYCHRDPLDVCLSIYFQQFNLQHKYAFDLMDIGHHYMQHVRLMSHWKKVLPGPLLEVQYEDLVSDPETNSRKLLEFCGLEWDPSCLEFYNKQRDVRTASNWQVRQPIYKSSVRRWHNYEKYLGPLMQLFAERKDEL